MADLAARKGQLRARIKRRREEIQTFLDDRFYRSARELLRRAEALDRDALFRSDPSRLPEYTLSVRQPMYWTLIGKKLSSYEYTTPQEFMADMRLVSDNCYAYNGVSSKFSSVARSIEIELEDAFVKELGETPPSVAEMKSLSKKLPPQASTEIIKVFDRYEKKETKTTNAKAFISLANCRCATKRRILQVMRDAVRRRDAKGPVNPPARKAAVPPAGSGMPVKRPLAPPTGDANAKVAMKPNPASSPASFVQNGVVQAADDVGFHEEGAVQAAARVEAHLERVPQNTRTDAFTLRDISPARLDESLSDEDGSDSMVGSSFSRQESGFDPLSDVGGVPTDGHGAEEATGAVAPPGEIAERMDNTAKGVTNAAHSPVPPAAVPPGEESLHFNENL